jgi:hypothetical protein
MKRFVTIIGVCWAIFAWCLWFVQPHRGYQTALICGIFLAPSYLFLSAFRATAIPMRIFVASALLILIIVGLRIIPGRYDMIWVYFFCPPALALVVAGCRYFRRGSHVF